VWVCVCSACDEQPKIDSIHSRMAERGVRLQELKEQMNGVEDEVFRKFCREIGVANIRSILIVFKKRFYRFQLTVHANNRVYATMCHSSICLSSVTFRTVAKRYWYVVGW